MGGGNVQQTSPIDGYNLWRMSRRTFVRLSLGVLLGLRVANAGSPIPQIIPPLVSTLDTTKNKILRLDASVSVIKKITVSIYEWKINNKIILKKVNTIYINTNDLRPGTNTISLRVQNSCGAWSKYKTKIVNMS